MEVSTDFQARRLRTIGENLTECEVALKASPPFGFGLGLEQRMEEYKYQGATFVALHRDRIKGQSKEFDTLREALLKSSLLELKTNALVIKDVLTMEITFNDGYGYLADREMIDKLRVPVTNTYLNIFKTKVALVQNKSTEDFSKCLDIPYIRENLHLSDWVRGIANFIKKPKIVDHLYRIDRMLSQMDKDLSTQINTLISFANKLLGALTSGSGLVSSDRINLDGVETVCFGETISSNILNGIRLSYYQNNNKSSLGNISGDTASILADLNDVLLVEHRDDSFKIETLIENLCDDRTFVYLTSIQKTTFAIIAKIDMAIDLLVGLSEKIIDIPSNVNENIYLANTIELSKYVNGSAEQMSMLTKFLFLLNNGIFSSMNNVENLSKVLRLHRSTITNYVEQRKVTR